MIDLNQSAVFMSVARHGSFTVAARALGLPKSTVSKKVTDLERRLGVTLLKRTTRKLSLTDAGAEYYQACSRAINEIEEAELSAVNGQSIPRGVLRVTAPVDMGVYLMPAVVKEFHRKYPEVIVDLLLDDRVLDLVGDRVDLAVRAGKLKDSSLVATRLIMGEFVAVASPAYLREHGTPESPADLINHTFLRFTGTRNPAVHTLERGKERVELKFRGNILSSQIDSLKHLALAGTGVALVPLFMVRREIHTGSLVRVLPEWHAAREPVHAVYPRQSFVPAKTRAFLEILKTVMARTEGECEKARASAAETPARKRATMGGS